jgi:hypothetical protein
MRERLVVMVGLLAIVVVALWPHLPKAQAQSGEAWECSLDAVGATLTLCEQAQPGLRLYITDIVMQSVTATGGLMLIRGGTGANCATGTASILPSAAAVPRLAYPANDVHTTHINLETPVAAQRNADLCVICTVTNTCSIQLTGFAAP